MSLCVWSHGEASIGITDPRRRIDGVLRCSAASRAAAVSASRVFCSARRSRATSSDSTAAASRCAAAASSAARSARRIARSASAKRASVLFSRVAAVSVGIYAGEAVLDLDYAEDSQAETDLNVVMNEAGGLIEVQGTAEGHAFTRVELDRMLDLAAGGIKHIIVVQEQVEAKDG